jgi:hypothetical protein
MKIVRSLLLFVPLVAIADTTTTPGLWDLYRGSSLASRHASEAECVQAADDRDEIGTYTCRTRTTVVVTADGAAPSPVDCVVGSWGAWAPGTWSTCDAGMQSRTETRTRSILTEPAAGGGECPALTETRTVTQSCTGTQPSTSGNLIFDASYANDVGNWDAEAGEDRHTDRRRQERVAGGGPNGRDAFEIRQLVDSRGEFYQGHVKTIPAFAPGVSRFFRFRLWHDPANNYLATGSNSRTINKLLIVGSSGGSGSRMILNANGYRNSGPALEIIFDGWNSAPPETNILPKGQWLSIQVEARWGSSGYINVWVNNDNKDSPTIRLCCQNVSLTSTPGYVHFGAYPNTGLASGGVHNFREADFEIGDSFDPQWHARR